MATQTRLPDPVVSPGAPPPPQLVPESATVGTWGAVYGELLSFDDPESRLPAIDRLEGFTRAVTACTAACCKEDTAVI